jgi:succinate dehydrogenase/fumarate reductase flavoprotein subunit
VRRRQNVTRGLEKTVIDCDLLVIGGGLAGCFAAIRGADLGVKTVLVEKANTVRSGAAATGVDHIWAYFPEIQGPRGYTVEDLIEDHTRQMDGMIHQDLLRVIADNALDRIHDLEKMGVKIRYDQSKLPGKYILVRQVQSVINTLNFDGRDIKLHMAREVRRRGAKVVNRVMMNELVVRDGRVVGALGVGTRDQKLYLFRSKATILCTARISGGRMFNEPGPGAGIAFNLRWPPSETGDGKVMAFKAGAELINLEFSHHRVNFKNFVRGGGLPYNSYSPAGQGINAFGAVIMPPEKEVFQDSTEGIYTAPKHKLIDELMQGRGPIYCDLTTGTEEEIKFSEWSVSHEGGGTALLHLMQREGIDFRKDRLEMGPGEVELGNFGAGGLYVDGDCHSTLPGLFVAGDEIGGVPLATAPGALTTGWYAAEKGIAWLKKHGAPARFSKSDGEVQQCEDRCLAIVNRKDGQRWQEAQVALNRIMNYYGLKLKTEKMIQRGLENLHDVTTHLELKAYNPHELMRCLEMQNLFLNAELVLRGNLERKETRNIKSMNIHLRLDYPKQDDENWKCALSQKLEDGKIVFAKRPFRRI